jgi:hypothetical protein
MPRHSRISLFLAVVTSCCCARVALAQTANPVATAFRGTLQRAQRNLVADAESMPADKYAYKPTDAHMTFAQHMIHMAEFNDMMCPLIGGGAAPARAKLAPTADKEAIVTQLRASFDGCTSSVASLEDARLADGVKLFGGDATRATALLILSGDWSDHYAVTATYLRLNGVLPPTARK